MCENLHKNVGPTSIKKNEKLVEHPCCTIYYKTLKPMKRIIGIVISVIILSSFISCDRNEDNGLLSLTIKDAITDNGVLKSISESAPSSIFISVKDESGNFVLNGEKIELVMLGDGYYTKHIELDEGIYTIEDFLVLDENDSTIFITPKADSELAGLVNNPLPIEFEILAGKTTELEIEVVDVALGDPVDFGYVTIAIRFLDFSRLDSALVLYLPFDGSTEDMSGYGNHAIDSTEGIYDPGIKGFGLLFNGTTDFLTLTSTFTFTDELSFAFWVKSGGPVEDQNLGVIFSKYSYSNRCMSIATYGYGENKDRSRLSSHFYPESFTASKKDWLESDMTNAYISEKGGDSTVYSLVDPKELVLNEWVHCVINLTSDTMEMYLDGKLVVKKIREYASYADAPFEPTYIGNMFDGADGDNNHLNGSLDEFRVYSRSLELHEIRALYLGIE